MSFQTDTTAYAGRNTVNPTIKDLYALAPKLINHSSKENDKIKEATIRQLINKGGQQIQKIAPQIIWRQRCLQNTIQDAGETLQIKGLSRKSIEAGQKMITDKIYPGCAIMYPNGERELIDFEIGKGCLIPTVKPFWSIPQFSVCRQGVQQKRNNWSKDLLIFKIYKK